VSPALERLKNKFMDRDSLDLSDADRAKAAPEVFADFVAVVRRLRRECPWDREQTHESVRHLLIEEAYEAVDAIDNRDWEDLKGELGDLLLHVVFHSEIAETTHGKFEFEDVVRAITEKLVRRHPHVFGDVAVSGTGEVLRNWEQIKQSERAARGAQRRSALDGVPRHLPALLRAHRVQEKAAGVGFDFPEAAGAWAKVEEELQELNLRANEGAALAHLEDEFGDLFFAMVNYARFIGVNPEIALRATVDKFQRRFTHIEARLAELGKALDDASLEEMDSYWDEAKEAER
jgi:MazG family protein